MKLQGKLGTRSKASKSGGKLSYLWKHISGNKDQLQGETMPQTQEGLPFHEDIHKTVKFHEMGG